MDAAKFTDAATGQLTRVTIDGEPDWAFTPDPLPPAGWHFPLRLWPLLSEARQQLARLDEKGRGFANPSLLMKPLQKREAVASSRIEGTYATAKDLLLFELGSKESNDPASSEEVANYDKALRFGASNLARPDDPSTLPLSNRLIVEMHKILMHGVRGSDSAPGEFRRHIVYLGSSRRYVPPPSGDAMTTALNALEAGLNRCPPHIDPLVWSYLLHYQFEAIHPFRDGNGRAGRLLLALTTFKGCELHLPWLYMSSFFDRFKDEYIDNLFRVSTHGDWERWIEFCLRGTIVQAKDAIVRCDAINSLQRRMMSELNHLPRMGKIIERVFVDPIFTVNSVAEWTDCSPPTARRDIDLLTTAGHVEHLHGERPKFYFVPKIFEAAYGEMKPDSSDQPPDESRPIQ